MTKVKDKIKKDIFNLASEVDRLNDVIEYKNTGLRMARAFELEKTGNKKTKFDKYLELK